MCACMPSRVFPRRTGGRLPQQVDQGIPHSTTGMASSACQSSTWCWWMLCLSNEVPYITIHKKSMRAKDSVCGYRLSPITRITRAKPKDTCRVTHRHHHQPSWGCKQAQHKLVLGARDISAEDQLQSSRVRSTVGTHANASSRCCSRM